MKRVPQIERDTPILPHVIAEAIREEASVWLGQPLPRRWVRELIARANTLYARSPRFRRSVRAADDRGRDHLWVFMRHWLAGLMKERRPHLYARMPASHSKGHPLPAPPAAPPPPYPYALPPRPRPLPSPVKTVRGIAPRVRPFSLHRSNYAWAAAAHLHLAF